MKDELDEAIIACLNGEIDDAGLAALDLRLRQDPNAARRFAQLCDHGVVLASVLRMRSAEKSETQTQRQARPRSRRVQRRTNTQGLWVGAAAALIAIGLLWVLLHDRASKPDGVAQDGHPIQSVAVLTELMGSAHVQRGGENVIAKLNAKLQAGDQIAAAQNSQVVISYDDGTKMTLEADTTLALPQSPGKPIQLLRGAIVAAVAHQPEGMPLRVATPQAEAVIVGTQFRLAVLSAATRLDVTEGRVNLTREKDKTSVIVDAGFSATATAVADTPMVLKRLQTLADTLPDHAQTWVRAAFADAPADWEGELAAPPDSPAGTRAIGSHLPQAGTRFYGEIRSPILAPGISAGERTYLRFRYRADGFNAGDLIKFMLKKKDGSIFHGFMKPESGHWAVATIRLDGAFRNLDEKRAALKPGETISQVVFLGAAPDGDVARAGPRLWLDEVIAFDAPGVVQVIPVEPP